MDSRWKMKLTNCLLFCPFYKTFSFCPVAFCILSSLLRKNHPLCCKVQWIRCSAGSQHWEQKCRYICILISLPLYEKIHIQVIFLKSSHVKKMLISPVISFIMLWKPVTLLISWKGSATVLCPYLRSLKLKACKCSNVFKHFPIIWRGWL